jgi:hypothetical protein
MPQEMNEGVAYLRALKQSTNRPDAGPPETGASEKPPDLAAATVGERFQGSEKRRGPRYKCEGSAQIREEGKEVHTWATFSDISVHGCYVEAQATYPAGTILHMKMETNTIRFEAKGSVRVSYPYLGMGIAFTEMTEENEAHLRRLLAAVSQPSVIMGPGIASSLPSTAPLEAMPTISNPAAALQELIEFFESRQMLMRDDFVRILKKSQK